MNRIDRIIQNMRLQPGDAVVINKTFFETSDPYAIYLGKDGMSQLFLVRAGQELFWLEPQDIQELFLYHPPRRVNRFVGTSGQRRQIVHRLQGQPDMNGYALLLNHCEDYASVQKDSSASKGNTAAIIGGLLGGAALIGLAAWLLSGDDDD